MLDSMRGLAKSFVAKGLMTLLVLSFALWGVGDIVRSQSSGTLASVGGESIGPNQFIGEVRQMQQAMAQMGVTDINPQALQGEVLRRMIQERLLTQWAHDTGLRVNRETLAQTVRFVLRPARSYRM